MTLPAALSLAESILLATIGAVIVIAMFGDRRGMRLGDPVRIKRDL